jgi:hypothetical protein
MKPRFREGEIVRLAGDPGPASIEAVVDDIAGPDDAGAGWAVSVTVERPGRGGRSVWVVREDELESTGFAEGPDGERVPVAVVPPAAERRTVLELRVVTSLTDSSLAAQVAENIELALRDLVGHCRISIEAERHWADPFHYELDVSVEPLGDPVEALLTIAEAGMDGWLSCIDDGWRCNLWWSQPDDDAVFLVPEIHGAEVSFLPWDDPSLRPESERPLVAVEAGDGYDEPV